jgi:hypothetical protein
VVESYQHVLQAEGLAREFYDSVKLLLKTGSFATPQHAGRNHHTRGISGGDRLACRNLVEKKNRATRDRDTIHTCATQKDSSLDVAHTVAESVSPDSSEQVSGIRRWNRTSDGAPPTVFVIPP